ncbi:hypothetical protein BJF93_20020 [Xaviernesmea oryzae]|uniref:DUF2264 domain-containing protein n=1 Tax=Xaviernesmea oryzae TaxID=464029 RepID=A0A1Q9AYV4_9HYPH|nr:DUF2264 domain-containing protein [Xaviernesmea oryzae]OLP60611.1 hypothetical protein BJF93_20020 [Xaviernesmea oryzae]SEM33077.1 hypothetical protein SAMN04487976_12921 [Xaviernesmea oryzae]
MTDPLLKANPLHGNPLAGRADLEKAARDCVQPLLPFFSESGARVRLSGAAAIFDRAAAELEGFARPLWGLAPLAAGGGGFDHWALYRRGLVAGMDPSHPDYWGDVADRNQRLVELAAIGLALALVPENIFEPLDPREKSIVTTYLLRARARDYVDNNWKFFRVLVDLGLERCGIEVDRDGTHAYLDQLEGFALEDGWYRDGPVRRADHYVPFAMHFYGLIYARLQQGDEARAERFRQRARRFALNIRHWYGPDGAALAFGRSQTYRFAAAGFWAALAFADVEALPWGEIKGYYLRHLRWWSAQPLADRDGVLSVGYAYPNLLVSESYNSAGSPYWAMKAFLPLALAEGHPFWQAEELPAPHFDAPVPLRPAGMVAQHMPGNVTLLSCGQEHEAMRGAAEKYAKFAYSTRYGFSVEANDRHFDGAALDGMIGFSFDGKHFRMRELLEEARIAGDLLYARWRVFDEIAVETWLIPATPWHIRLHRIATPRAVKTIEGGFSVRRADFNIDRCTAEAGRAEAQTATDISVIADLSPGQSRAARTHFPLPNTHLLHSKTIVPQLLGELPPGVTLLATAAMALPLDVESTDAALNVPALPDLAAIEARFAAEGVVPDVFALPMSPASGPRPN